MASRRRLQLVGVAGFGASRRCTKQATWSEWGGSARAATEARVSSHRRVVDAAWRVAKGGAPPRASGHSVAMRQGPTRTKTPAVPPLQETLASRRFGLVLSAGYFGFFAHGGLLAALEQAGLRPAAWAGSSAGALVGALGASGMPAGDIAAMMTRVAKADFWDPAPVEQLVDAVRGRGMTGLLRGDRFRALLERQLPARFEDCREPLAIVTADVTRAASRVHVAGPLPPIVHASCAYPGLFRTVDEDGTQSWDGGLIDKAPIVALTEHADVDALLVLYLPSDTKHDAAARPRRVGYLGGMMRGLAAVRHEHYVLQAKLAEARGIPVYELSPVLPKLGPSRLALGPAVLEESAQIALAALAEDANRWRAHVWRA